MTGKGAGVEGGGDEADASMLMEHVFKRLSKF